LAARDIIIALVLALVWGFSFITIKWGVMEVPPFMFSALRFFFASIPAVFFIRRPRGVSTSVVIAYGFAIGVVQFGLLFIAIRNGMPVGLASLVVQMHAFFTIFLAWVAMGEVPVRSQIIGALIALFGVALIGSERLEGAEFLPFLLTLCAAFSWGIGNTLGKKVDRGEMIPFMVWSSLAAPLPLVLLSFVFEGEAGFAAVMVPMWFGIGCALFLAYAATLFGFVVWGRLLSKYPAALVAPYAMLVPVFGMVFSWAILKETFSAIELVGAGLVLAGLSFHTISGRVGGGVASRPAD
jgi:O-acetylserine/cysteine efflux transporter